MPFLPSDVERDNPGLAQEFEMVTSQLREFTTRIALLDRVHSIKVRGAPCRLTPPLWWCEKIHQSFRA